MAEEQTQTVDTNVQDTTVEEQASNPKQEPEKTVSIAEMQRRLEQAEKKHAQSTQEAIDKALAKYKAETELSGKELEEYRRKEAETEKQSLLDKIAGLEKEQTKRELTDEAIKTLSSRKLPISEIKSEYTQSEPPAVSTAFGGSKTQSSGEIFRNSRII